MSAQHSTRTHTADGVARGGGALLGVGEVSAKTKAVSLKSEKVFVPTKNKPFVSFFGAGSGSTKITYGDTKSDTDSGKTQDSATVGVNSDGFIAKGITFELELELDLKKKHRAARVHFPSEAPERSHLRRDLPFSQARLRFLRSYIHCYLQRDLPSMTRSTIFYTSIHKMSPRHHYGMYDTETPPGYSYIIDATGAIVRNDDGERVFEYMKRITWNIFRYDLLKTWKEVEEDRKHYACSLIKAEFPQPHKEAEFRDDYMMHEMGVLMGHRRSEARDRYKEGKSKPSWCEEEIWEIIKDERDKNPNKYEQQVRARAQQSSSQTSHLGSGGKQAFKRDFQAEFGRKPTSYEANYATANGYAKLREKLEAKDDWPPTPLCDDDLSE